MLQFFNFTDLTSLPGIGLTLFRAGSERFDSGRGGGDSAPVRSRKPSIGATSGKRRWIGLSKTHIFLHKTFSGQVNIKVTRGHQK